MLYAVKRVSESYATFRILTDSLTHRASVRSALATNVEWLQQYVVPALNPAILSQDNLLMRPVNGTSITLPDSTGMHSAEIHNISQVLLVSFAVPVALIALGAIPTYSCSEINCIWKKMLGYILK